jgi:phosphatidate cytidylyltransferase
MLRVLSALVLLPIVVGTVWFLPAVWTLVLAVAVSILAFVEYAAIAQKLGATVPRVAAGFLVAAVAGAASGLHYAADVALMSGVILVGALAVASGQPGAAILRDAAASLFPALYIGMPLGALAAIRFLSGREAVLLLMATIVVSDSAQYYCGRAFGRRRLAPSISPKKTVAGAVGGVLFGTAAMVLVGMRVFDARLPVLVMVGATIVALGIVGDLFESLLKRSADVKDSGTLIPGHGGVLDRIDSWLFAAPVYYVFVRYLQF